MELRTQSQPPPHGPELYIRRLKAGQKLRVIVLSTALWGTWTHWEGNHSGPCFKDKKQCPGCKKGLPSRWKGYLHVHNTENRHMEFLELTPLAADSLLSQVGKGTPLRGLQLSCERMRGDKARLKVTLLPALLDTANFPPTFSPFETLKALWGIPDVIVTPDPATDLPFTQILG